MLNTVTPPDGGGLFGDPEPRRKKPGAARPLAGSNLLALPFSDGLTPTSYALPEELSADQWIEVGRALGRVRGSIMWWVGDWWGYGEHAYGERTKIVDSDDWNGPAKKTCENAASVCRAFETSRRREVLSFTAHLETAVLPVEWQDAILEGAIVNGGATRAIRDEVKRVRAQLAQGWTPDQLERKAQAEAGQCVVANMRDDGAGRRIDEALLCWAEVEDRAVRIDRASAWGNPFEMPADGDRIEVCGMFQRFYWPHKRGLLNRAKELRGKVCACWCHPEPCHGHLIAETVNLEATGQGTAAEVAAKIAEIGE